MKNLILIISSVLLFTLFFVNKDAMSSPVVQTPNDSICVWSSSALYNLTTTLVGEYSKANQDAKVKVISAKEAKITDKLKAAGNIGFITKDQLTALSPKPIWSLAVARDIVVPVMNSKNPYRDQIYSKGLSAEDFATAFTSSEKSRWGSLLENDESAPVNCYFIDDESTIPYLSKFMQTGDRKITGKAVANYDQMLVSIQNDKYAIGFCKLVDIINFENQEINQNLTLIPIDINGNNQIDYNENIYKNSTAFTRGIWIGKYPKTLFNNIYAVADIRPSKSEDLALMKWVLTEGQQYLHTKGYSELISSERMPKVQSLFAYQTPKKDIPYKSILPLTMFFIIGIGIIALFFIYRIFKGAKEEPQKVISVNYPIPPVYTESSVEAPRGLFYDKSHTWAFMESNGFVRVGIDDFLQHITGQITKVKMMAEGEKIKKGEPFLSLIQHGKQLNILSPISGTITQNNTRLNTHSSVLNSSPYTEGWVYVMESSNWLKDIKTFIRGETYRDWIKNEFTRVKEFLFSTIKPEEMHNLQYVMQDGGELVDNLLENFGPEIWEEFQSKFIKHAKKRNSF